MGSALTSACLLACWALRNHDASTGTIVSATSSEASSAIETVNANGRKSSPTWPPTRAIGIKTATVAMVEDVIAPATSFTAGTMVRMGLMPGRSEEHTSELQSRGHLVCRLLLENK